MAFQLDTVLEQAHELAPLPANAARLASLIADPESNIDEVVEVANFDMSLTARLLRVANAASSGARTPVTSIKDAIVRMGPGALLSFVMGIAVRRDLDQPAACYDLEEGALWRHSVKAAIAAEEIRSAAKALIPSEAFTAALLHDIGKLVMSRYIDDETDGWLRRARTEGHRQPHAAELEILEMHHGEFGAIIARNWGLPATIVAAIQHHHEPANALGEDPDHLCYAVYLANLIAKSQTAEEILLQDTCGALNILELAASQCDDIYTKVAERFETVLAAYD